MNKEIMNIMLKKMPKDLVKLTLEYCRQKSPTAVLMDRLIDFYKQAGVVFIIRNNLFGNLYKIVMSTES